MENSITKYAAKHCSNGISLSYKTVALKECADSDELMSRIVEICMNAINKMAVYDFLTGVYNRNFFEKELLQLKKDSEDTYYFIADLNNLKEANDVMGHSAGDELLQSVAKLLADTAGKMGKVFRQGGDEFAVLWKGKDAKIFLEELEKKRLRLNEGRAIPVSFAIGYGRILEEGGIEKADKMMYENKAKMKGGKR